MNNRFIVLVVFVFTFLFSCGEDKITNPGIIYNGTVQIGTQVWLLKNLDVEHYRNGDPIPEVKDSAQWANLTTGAWCYYNNDPVLGAIYGKLYNWYAVNDSRGLAPDGWHIPSYSEWTVLSDYLGGDMVSGGKMKETGSTHWNIPNEGTTNFSNFYALPGGERSSEYNGFWGLGIRCRLWSSTVEESFSDINKIWLYYKYLSNDDPYLEGNSRNPTAGFSVRCIKDK
jgi:uncharacterized protein (TIGR02145 family)